LNKEEPEKAHRPHTRRSIDSLVKEIAKLVDTEIQALRAIANPQRVRIQLQPTPKRPLGRAPSMAEREIPVSLR
jgi:hypothetical protein